MCIPVSQPEVLSPLIYYKNSVTIQLQIAMKLKAEGILTRKRNLSSHVKTETMHKGRKVIAMRKLRKYIDDYLDQLLQCRIETCILALSYKFAYIFYNQHSIEKIVLFCGLMDITYFK